MDRPENAPELLRERLRAAIKEAGNASAVARAIGASPSQLSDWIAERYNPELEKLGRIAKGLKLTLAEIFSVRPSSDLSQPTKVLEPIGVVGEKLRDLARHADQLSSRTSRGRDHENPAAPDLPESELLLRILARLSQAERLAVMRAYAGILHEQVGGDSQDESANLRSDRQFHSGRARQKRAGKRRK
jgi:transcriptional regulator with XRE-family HTH domain